MTKGKALLRTLIVIAVFATGGTPAPVAAESIAGQLQFRTINAAQLADELNHKDFVLVNVHVPYEAEIAQTDLFIPFDMIADHLAELPSDKNARIVLYCRSGRMSEIAANTLARLGYTNVTDVAGGMNAWAALGLNLVRR